MDIVALFLAIRQSIQLFTISCDVNSMFFTSHSTLDLRSTRAEISGHISQHVVALLPPPQNDHLASNHLP